MELTGAVLHDRERVEVGHVRSVLLDPATLDARWLEVELSVGGGSVVVPAAAVSQYAEGRLVVPWTADQITQAGHATGTPLTAERAQRLREHYGFTG